MRWRRPWLALWCRTVAGPGKAVKASLLRGACRSSPAPASRRREIFVVVTRLRNEVSSTASASVDGHARAFHRCCPRGPPMVSTRSPSTRCMSPSISVARSTICEGRRPGSAEHRGRGRSQKEAAKSRDVLAGWACTGVLDAHSSQVPERAPGPGALSDGADRALWRGGNRSGNHGARGCWPLASSAVLQDMSRLV